MSSPPSKDSWVTSGWDRLGAAVLGSAAAVVAISHLGAALAAAVFGGGALDANVSDSATAVIALPAHLSDPARAWGAAGASLPGPVAMWMCLLFTASAAGFVVGGVWVLWRRLDNGKPNAFGIVPNLGFARRRDIGRLAVPGPERGRLTLGRARGRLIAAEPQASLAVVGPTGCGKTAGFAIPALLEWDGPVIATSVKADLLSATIRRRQQQGTVWVYDPTASSGFQPAARWSPLASCASWPGAMRMAAWLAEAAQPRFDSVSDGDYWYSQARKGLAPHLYAAAVSGRTMEDVVRWIDLQEVVEVEVALRRVSGLEAALADAMSSEEAERRRTMHREKVRTATIASIRKVMRDERGGRASLADRPVSGWPVETQEHLDARVAEELNAVVATELEADLTETLSASGRLAALIAVRSLWDRDPRVRDSVYATIQNVVGGYADPGVGAASENPDVDMAEWLAGNNTIYVVATAHEQARLRPVLTVIVQQAIRAAYDTAAAAGGRLSRPCLVLLDEAGNTAPLRDLPGYASTARSHGITLVSVWQDLAQVKALYHDRAQTVLNNHRARLFGTGIADEATLDYVSRLIGDERHTERNLSADLTGVGGRRTLSEHTSYRRAAPVDTLRRIRPNEAVLLYGSELPVHVHLRPWFDDGALRSLAEDGRR